jgi:hypothetical protein
LFVRRQTRSCVWSVPPIRAKPGNPVTVLSCRQQLRLVRLGHGVKLTGVSK